MSAPCFPHEVFRKSCSLCQDEVFLLRPQLGDAQGGILGTALTVGSRTRLTERSKASAWEWRVCVEMSWVAGEDGCSRAMNLAAGYNPGLTGLRFHPDSAQCQDKIPTADEHTQNILVVAYQVPISTMPGMLIWRWELPLDQSCRGMMSPGAEIDQTVCRFDHLPHAGDTAPWFTST